MLTRRRARRIREGITAGHQQAQFERMYSRGGERRFTLPGALNAQDGAPNHFPGLVAYWRTLGRTSRETSPLIRTR
jgi:hypothetical protein